MPEEVYGGGGAGGLGNLFAGTNITISSSGNSATIIGGVNTGATTFLAGAVGTNTSGTAGTVNNQMLFAGGSNITLSQSINANSATISFIGNAPFKGGVSTVGNTLGDTKTVSNQIVFAGGNNITLSQVTGAGGATITISGPNAGGAQTGISGIAGSAASTVTAGTIQFANANNMSFGLNGSTMTGSFSQSVQPAQTGLSGVSASDTVYTSGTFKITGSNMITVRSGAGQAIIIDATQSVQPAQTGISGIAASNASTVAAGTVQFANANNVTFGLAGSTITASASFSGGAGGFQSAGISTGGNTAGTTGFASSQILFYGGTNITLSQSLGAGNVSLSIIGASGGAGGIAASIGGNSTSAGAGYSNITSGTAVLMGGNNITLSQDGASITISGANVGGAQTGISGIAGSAASTVTVGTVQFANSNGISFGLNSVTMTASHNAITSQSNQQMTFYATSNTIGASSGTINASSIILKGNDRLSVGVQNGSLLFELGGADTHTNVIGMSNLGNSFGMSGVISTLNWRYIIAGGGNISLSQSIDGSSGTLTIIGKNQSNESQWIGVGNLGSALGTTGWVSGAQIQVNLVGGNNITLSQSLNAASDIGTITIIGPAPGTAQSVQTQGSVQINGSTGVISFFAGANMSLSTVASNLTFINELSTSNSAADIGTASNAGTGSSLFAMYDHVHRGVGGIAASGTATTFVGSVVLSGGNNITLSTAGNSTAGTIAIHGPNTVAVPTINESIYPVASANSIGAQALYAAQDHKHAGVFSIGMSTNGNTQGTTAILPGQMVFIGSNNITLSQSTAAGNLMTLAIVGGAGGAFSGGVSSGGNTAGATGTVGSQIVFVGSNNITLSQSVNGASATITISGGAGGGGAALGITNTGNTSGTNFTTSTGTVYFQGTNNITVSNSSAAGSLQTIWISGPTGGGAGMGTGTNTSGTSGSVGKQLYFYGNSKVTLSQSMDANSLSGSLSIIAGGGAAPEISRWNNLHLAFGRTDSAPNWQGLGTSQSSLYIMPLKIDGEPWNGNMTVSTAFVFMSGSISGAASTAAKTLSMFLGLYTENAGSLSLLNSVSASVGSGGAAANMTASFHGPRLFSAVSSAWSAAPSLVDGSHYYLGYMMQSAGESFALSWRGVFGASGQVSGTMGSSIAATNTTMRSSPWFGVYTAQTAVLPAVISQAHLRATGSAEMFVPVIQFENRMSNF